MNNDVIVPQKVEKQDILPEDYNNWRKKIILLIEQSKLKAIFSVNAELLALYWKIGKDILTKQKEQGWGAKVIVQLSKDLAERFPDDRGFSERNLRNMKKFASEYPAFPIWQVPLAELEQLPIRKAALAELPCDENGFLMSSMEWLFGISEQPLLCQVLYQVTGIQSWIFCILVDVYLSANNSIENLQRKFAIVNLQNGTFLGWGGLRNRKFRSFPRGGNFLQRKN